MNNRNQTIWVILIVLSIISIITASVKIIPINNKWNRAKERAENIQYGTDKELEEVIYYLEERLKDRANYQFALEEEPMRLTNVLFLRDAYGRSLRYRRSGKLRVTHIIDGSTQYAGINYKDKNYSVVVGDSIAGGVVKWIDKEKVIIYKDGQELPYPVSGLTVEE